MNFRLFYNKWILSKVMNTGIYKEDFLAKPMKYDYYPPRVIYRWYFDPVYEYIYSG